MPSRSLVETFVRPFAPDHAIFDDAHFRWLHPDHTSTRELGVDPSSVARDFTEARAVHQHEFRMVDENGDMECPVSASYFVA